MNGKWMKWAGAAVALTITLAGCGSQSGGNAGNSGGGGSGGSGGSGGAVTLQFEHWRGEDVPTFDKMIQAFEAKYPNIKVQQTALPSSSYVAQIQTTFTGSHGADIFATFPGSQFLTLNKMGVYEDLTGQSFLSRFQSSLITAGQADGKQLAVPWQLVYNDPVYNVDLFKQYNIAVPTTWDQFLKACQTLKDHGIVPIAWVGNISQTQFINDLLMNNMPSTDVFTKVSDGQAKLTDSWYTTTLSELKTLVDKGYLEPNASGTSQAGAEALMASGKAAMLALGSYDMTNLHKLNPKLNLGLLCPITTNDGSPKYEGIYTATFMLGINKNSQHIKEAEEFLDFITQPDMAAEYANGTGQFLTEKGIQYSAQDLKYLSDTWLPKTDLMYQPRLTIPNAGVQKAVENSVADVVAGMSVQDAVSKAQKAVDQAIKTSK